MAHRTSGAMGKFLAACASGIRSGDDRAVAGAMEKLWRAIQASRPRLAGNSRNGVGRKPADRGVGGNLCAFGPFCFRLCFPTFDIA